MSNLEWSIFWLRLSVNIGSTDSSWISSLSVSNWCGCAINVGLRSWKKPNARTWLYHQQSIALTRCRCDKNITVNPRNNGMNFHCAFVLALMFSAEALIYTLLENKSGKWCPLHYCVPSCITHVHPEWLPFFLDSFSGPPLTYSTNDIALPLTMARFKEVPTGIYVKDCLMVSNNIDNKHVPIAVLWQRALCPVVDSIDSRYLLSK